MKTLLPLLLSTTSLVGSILPVKASSFVSVDVGMRQSQLEISDVEGNDRTTTFSLGVQRERQVLIHNEIQVVGGANRGKKSSSMVDSRRKRSQLQ